MIKKVIIRNFRIFDSFTLNLNDDLNLVVGNNESGKSTLLEAIGLALTKRIGGKLIEYELSPYFFNKLCADTYLAQLKAGAKPALPEILIELYLKELPEFEALRGTNNSLRTDTTGVKLEIVFDDGYTEEYIRLCEDKSEKKVIPAEYYKVNWFSFANNQITARSLPLTLFHIDATAIRLQSGADQYIQNIISGSLPPKERVALAVAYRKLKEQFSEEQSIKDINKNLTKGAITEKDLTITVDISQKASWETNLTPHLDDLPFQLVGKGEQTALKIMLALDRKAKDSDVILIEEPENHLSFSSMCKLIAKIGDKCAGKQIIIATHSAYVLNRLGIDKVLLLHGNKYTSLAQLPPDTQNYFKKLSGYDTLRLILAKKAILVEGPSDELIVQKAYKVTHGKLPIENGVDVINVRGLSFSRFLDIAKELKKEVCVVTDNDGDHQHKVVEKYAPYSAITTIKICADTDNTAKTLEPQLAKCNTLTLLNKVLGTDHKTVDSLVGFMVANKTESALKIFESTEAVIFPKYVNDAVA
jgi:energy-coupling factor transporter ATP-binding protein EcfA2